MLEKVQIRTSEKDDRRKMIVRVLLGLYPYRGVIQEDTYGDATRYTFFTDHRNLRLLRHDLENLRLCEFNVEEVKVQ